MNKKRARTQRRLKSKGKVNNATHVEVYITIETKSNAGVTYTKYRKGLVKKNYG